MAAATLAGFRFYWRGFLPVVLALAAIPLMGQANADRDQDQALSRGQEISDAVSSVTGASISPLLGVCLFGAYQYARTPAPARASLPFYARSPIWITLAILLLAIFLKDTIGGVVPLLKKPLDAVEVLILNKASLVLLALPFMLDQVLPLVGIKSGAALLSLYEPVAYADSGVLQTAGHVGIVTLMVLAGLVITFVVWLVGHAIDVLGLLSPFPFVDLVFKGFRTAILLVVLITSLIDRRAGLILALAVIAAAVLMFSWALRLAILGVVFSWDFIRLMAFGRRAPAGGVQSKIAGFTAARIAGVRKQTFGKLARDPNGILEFRYRRLGFGPVRRIRLEDAASYEIGRGLLYPCVILPDEKRSGYKLQFRLPPRYTSVEDQVRVALGMSSLRDIRLRKGLRAFWRWVEGNAGGAEPAARGA